MEYNNNSAKNIKRKVAISLLSTLILILFLIISIINLNEILKSQNVIGRIYFRKPVSWDYSYAYMIDNNSKELLGQWPGKKLEQEEDYIYYFEVTEKVITDKENTENYKIIFNNGLNPAGEKYKVETKFDGCNKIYNIVGDIETMYGKISGEWLDYNEDITIGKIPNTENKIKNVIYMIGDGMGKNHITAGEIYKGEKLNIQKIINKSNVTTESMSIVTDSAAGATALATGNKTINGAVGKNKYGQDVENLIEYSKSKGLKTGMVCTQVLNHATPAGFSVHNSYRYNYSQIAKSEIEANLDLMLGGGRKYFRDNEILMKKANYTWINDFSKLKDISKKEKVIGTFAEESISEEKNRISLAQMTESALYRLENNNGFFLMIEGSDIDTYSHRGNMAKMLTELIDFDNAVKVAMEYIDKHSDTLLIVTADHETGGLVLDGVGSATQLKNSLFTSHGKHTGTDVSAYAYGVGSEDLTKYTTIDNTSIYKFVKQGLSNNYEDKSIVK